MKRNFFGLTFSIVLLYSVGIMLSADTQFLLRYCHWDFYAFWSAAKQFLLSGNPYRLEEYPNSLSDSCAGDTFPYAVMNPPQGLLLLFPIALLSFQAASSLFVISLVFSLAFILIITGLSVGQPTSLRERALSVLPVITFTPVLMTIYIGQISIQYTLLFCLFIYLYFRKDYFSSGLVLSLTVIKPHILYLLYLYIALRALGSRDMRVCLYGLLSGLTILTLSAVTVNPSIPEMYFDALLHIYKPGWMTPTIGSRLFELNNSLRLAWIGPVILGITILFLLNRQKLSERFSVLTITLWSVATTPYVWTYDFVLYLPFLLIVSAGTIGHAQEENQTKRILFLLAMNVVLVLNNFRWEHDFWYPWVFLILWYLTVGRAELSIKDELDNAQAFS